MKFIKLYEGFDQEDYYVKITSDEYTELFDDTESFNDRENEFLRKNKFEDYDGVDYMKTYTTKEGAIDYLTKLKDSYYIFSFSDWHSNTRELYKCDQWDGLIKLLKDKDII